jgi:hypothetical protein
VYAPIINETRGEKPPTVHQFFTDFCHLIRTWKNRLGSESNRLKVDEMQEMLRGGLGIVGSLIGFNLQQVAQIQQKLSSLEQKPQNLLGNSRPIERTFHLLLHGRILEADEAKQWIHIGDHAGKRALYRIEQTHNIFHKFVTGRLGGDRQLDQIIHRLLMAVGISFGLDSLERNDLVRVFNELCCCDSQMHSADALHNLRRRTRQFFKIKLLASNTGEQFEIMNSLDPRSLEQRVAQNKTTPKLTLPSQK